ncbi:unnamed protein product [Schistosoma margrebowiei]|uniref:Uncharacterized protein n=1 Tax=Schistosoma margrebowiei TaxID=48269 RepID=A0A3P8D0D1_9TREM|nr:unnamed protein product [Schistosoma margrebowiei]
MLIIIIIIILIIVNLIIPSTVTVFGKLRVI